MPIERLQSPGLGMSEETEEVSESTVTRLPKSILGGKDVAVGDVVRLTVTDLGDDDFGVKYAAEEAVEEPTKGVQAMAREFD